MHDSLETHHALHVTKKSLFSPRTSSDILLARSSFVVVCSLTGVRRTAGFTRSKLVSTTSVGRESHVNIYY